MQKTLFISLALLSSTAFAAPKSELWSYWQQSDEQNPQMLSHELWQQVLSHNLSISGQNTLFDYKNISPQDRNTLTRYIQNQIAIDPRNYNQAEQFSYWVNLYNALTVELILENYPVKSITKLGSWFSFGPWDETITTINGKALTLNDIEHRILRPIWQDARIHYAVNCASLGCPNLQPFAYTSENTQAMLEHAASEFINSDKGVDVKADQLQLSSIYDWYREDFGDEQQLLEHLSSYRPQLKNFKGTIHYQYNWNLNQK